MRTLGIALLGSALVLGLVLPACPDRAPAPSNAPTPASETAPVLPPAAPAATVAAADAASAFVPERMTDDSRHAMGTHVTLVAFTTPTVDADVVHRAFEAAVVEIERIETVMTTWRPDSEVSRINSAAGKSPIPVSQETFDIVAASLHTSEISQGAFDITFESLHGLWKFDQDLDPHPPTDAQIKAKLPLLSYRHVRMDAAKRTVFLDKAGVKIGLGGIAKGYAVDRAARVLLDAGITAFIVQAGGDLITHGQKPDGAPWSAGIRDPRGAEGAFFALLDVTDHAFSTAGDYERSYVVGDRRYHHIIDPHTGYPATASRSVTIWAPTALQADEIDDAVFILGPEKGLALVESLDGTGAVIVDAKNNLWVSKRLESKLKVIHPPTDGI
jgi:thiamine biosynthesis lipoprotein